VLIDELTGSDPARRSYVSLVSVAEICWVLRHASKVTAERCGELLAGLLSARELRSDGSAAVRAAVTATRSGLDLADAVVVELGRAVGCDPLGLLMSTHQMRVRAVPVERTPDSHDLCRVAIKVTNQNVPCFEGGVRRVPRLLRRPDRPLRRRPAPSRPVG